MKSLKAFLPLSFIFVITSPASAALVLDQSADAFAAGSDGGLNVHNFQSASQTFTVGIAGLLAQVDLQVQKAFSDPSDDLILSILGTTSGVPDLNQTLGSVAIAPGDVPPGDFNNVSFISVDVSSLGIFVSVGDLLALELTYPMGTGDYFWYEQNDFYAGGESFVRSPPETQFRFQGQDYGFRTWVETSMNVVPEPSALAIWGLMGLTLGGCAWLRWKKLRSRSFPSLGA